MPQIFDDYYGWELSAGIQGLRLLINIYIVPIGDVWTGIMGRISGLVEIIRIYG